MGCILSFYLVLKGSGQNKSCFTFVCMLYNVGCVLLGCRYGCICHLCQSIGESDDLEQGVSATSQGRACDKEYCRLGCICESLEKSSKRSSPLHCRKPECVLECQCLKEVPCGCLQAYIYFIMLE